MNQEKVEMFKVGWEAVFQIIGIAIPALVTLGILDPSNKVVKIWDKIGDLQKKIRLFRKNNK